MNTVINHKSIFTFRNHPWHHH